MEQEPQAGDSEEPAVARSGGDAGAGEDADLEAGLVGLSRLATDQLSLSEMLTHVAGFAVRAIPRVDGAGLTLLQAGRGDTIVASADFVQQVDDIQYSIGEGPCISAAAEGRLSCPVPSVATRRFPGSGRG